MLSGLGQPIDCCGCALEILQVGRGDSGYGRASPGRNHRE